jgi:predicted O-linked N-acetylglucosamine transferase (SPINDLY family)
VAPVLDTFRQAFAAFQRGDLAAAERGFRQVLRKEPRHPGALNLLAALLVTGQRPAEAEPLLAAAIRLKPPSDATFFNYALVLKSLGRSEEALARFSEAIALNPAQAESWNGRGTVYSELHRPSEAIADFDQALLRDPAHAGALFNKGKALTLLKRHDEAEAAYRAALARRADLAEAWYGLGALQAERKRHDEALDAFARARALNPALPFVAGNLLHQKMLLCDWRGVGELVDAIAADLAAGRPAAEPFTWQGIATSSASLRRCAELFHRQLHPAPPPRPPRTSAGERIRIGYLSGEFREQATSLLLVGVLEQHDRERFEIVAFDNGWDDGSTTRARIAAAVDRIVPIRDLGDAEAVAAIRAAGTELLVNLNGYFGEARHGIFARRAAPLQVNYLGFPGTLGTEVMDYIIADADVLPAADHVHFTEKVVTLPACYQANDHLRPVAGATPDRDSLGLPRDGVVYCCFNNAYKITPEVFARWMEILRAVPGSVMWLLDDGGSSAGNLRGHAAAAGIAPDRLVFAGRMPPAEHLARHRCADLFLDTLPYNAHTTASDALWAGLPLLTCRGTTFAGRVAASLLRAVGLPELITSSLDDYESLAVALGRDPARRAELRQRLSTNRATMPLFDTPAFTRQLEAAFDAMVARHRAGQPPAAIAISG